MTRSRKLASLGALGALVATGALATTFGERIVADDGGPERPRAVGSVTSAVHHHPLAPASEQEALDILLRRQELRAFGDPGAMTVDSVVPWDTGDGRRIGVAAVVRLPEPLSGTFPFIVNQPDDRQSGAAYRRYGLDLEVRGMTGLNVRIDLQTKRIAELSPLDGAEPGGAEQPPDHNGRNDVGGAAR